MPKRLQVPMEGVTLIEQCARVDCLFVGWYNDCVICTVTVRYTICKNIRILTVSNTKQLKIFNLTPLQSTAVACFVRVTFNQTFCIHCLQDQICKWTDSVVQKSIIFSYSLIVISNALAYI